MSGKNNIFLYSPGGYGPYSRIYFWADHITVEETGDEEVDSDNWMEAADEYCEENCRGQIDYGYYYMDRKAVEKLGDQTDPIFGGMKMSYHYPTNEQEYWLIVNEHWDNLHNILSMYLPKEELEQAELFKQQRNKEIAHLFNNAWFNAPDNRSIHAIPSWFVLCDLCSESYVLYEEEMNDDQESK